MTPDKDVAASAAPNGDLYLYEFLYRGRAPGSDQSPDYHVILAQDVTDAFGRATTSTSPAMTPAQAEAMGFELPAIVAAIDASTRTESVELEAQTTELRTKLDAARAELEALRAERTAALRATIDPTRDPSPTPAENAPAG